jgi:hypothetical protein
MSSVRLSVRNAKDQKQRIKKRGRDDCWCLFVVVV